MATATADAIKIANDALGSVWHDKRDFLVLLPLFVAPLVFVF